MTSKRAAHRDHGESGSSLVLALVFLVAVALVGLSLGRSISNDLGNSSNLSNQRSLEYAADGATSIALQKARYAGTVYQAQPTDCLGGGVTINNVVMRVFCSEQTYNPLSGVTRVVNFFACAQAQAPCSSGNAVLQAQVTFDDYSAAQPLVYACPPSCGYAATVNSWVLETANS